MKWGNGKGEVAGLGLFELGIVNAGDNTFEHTVFVAIGERGVHLQQIFQLCGGLGRINGLLYRYFLKNNLTLSLSGGSLRFNGVDALAEGGAVICSVF